MHNFSIFLSFLHFFSNINIKWALPIGSAQNNLLFYYIVTRKKRSVKRIAIQVTTISFFVYLPVAAVMTV